MVVYDKSYQHTTIYDSYDLELASKLIQIIKFENTTTTYSLAGKLLYDFEKDDDKNILYKIFTTKQCNGCSTVPLTQYKNDKIYQEITSEDDYTTTNTDDRIWIDMRRSKGYTDESEKINRNDSGLALIIDFKETAAKKIKALNNGVLTGWILVFIVKQRAYYVIQKLQHLWSRSSFKLKKQTKKRKAKKRGRGIPYIYKNKIYFGKKTQTRTGAVSRVIALLLENVGNLTGL